MLTNPHPNLSATCVQSRFTSSYVPAIARIVGLKIDDPSSLPASRLSGMKTQHSTPRRAAWAATLLARLPVDAHASTSNPSSSARVAATETTRSLYDRVG